MHSKNWHVEVIEFGALVTEPARVPRRLCVVQSKPARPTRATLGSMPKRESEEMSALRRTRVTADYTAVL